jgi:hypothetical protein
MSVWYRPSAAIDPQGKQPVTDVTVQLFAENDQTFSTPLTVEDESHVPMTSLRVTNYLTPGFWGPDEGVVVAKSGDWLTVLEATQGLRDAALDAADSAQELRDSAIVSVGSGDNIVVDNSDPRNPKISFQLDAVVLETNLYPDPGHEYTLSPFSSSPTSGSGLITLDPSLKHSGTKSISYSTTANNATYRSSTTFTPAALGLAAGDQLTLSAWVNVSSTSTPDSRGVIALINGTTGAFSANATAAAPTIVDDWAWVHCTATVSNPTGTFTIRLYGANNSGGLIHFDDFGLAKGPNPVDFSGDTPQSGNDLYRWRGTAGQSPSERFTPGITIVGGDGSSVSVTDNSSYYTITVDGVGYQVAKTGQALDLDDLTGVTEFAKTVIAAATDAASFRTAIGAGTGDGTGDVNSDSITDATTIGKAAITAENAAALTALLSAATATTKGIVELATTAEATAGTDTTRAVTPAGLAAAVAAKTVSLASIPAGMSFRIVYDGTNWKYNGATISARPTTRTDVYMVCYNPVDATVPSFALAGVDVLERAL